MVPATNAFKQSFRLQLRSKKMNNSTITATFDAPTDKVFAYVSNIENLPEWATGFCQELKKEGDGFKVVTPGGEVYFSTDGDATTGILDMVAGPQKDQTVTWPARVVGLPDGRSVLMFTAIQTPDTSDEAFAAQCGSLKEEFENIRRAVE